MRQLHHAFAPGKRRFRVRCLCHSWRIGALLRPLWVCHSLEICFASALSQPTVSTSDFRATTATGRNRRGFAGPAAPPSAASEPPPPPLEPAPLSFETLPTSSLRPMPIAASIAAPRSTISLASAPKPLETTSSLASTCPAAASASRPGIPTPSLLSSTSPFHLLANPRKPPPFSFPPASPTSIPSRIQTCFAAESPSSRFADARRFAPSLGRAVPRIVFRREVEIDCLTTQIDVQQKRNELQSCQEIGADLQGKAC